MLRRLVALYTVCSLLACPLVCMGEPAPDTAAARSAETCSCCCHRSACTGATGSPLPDGPRFPGDQCANCVCRGALVTKNDLNVGTEAAARAIDFQAHWLVDAAAVASQPPVPAVDASPPGPRSGRLIRYEMQSLLL